MRYWPLLAASLSSLLLAGCALPDAPPLSYQCPHDLRFTARLYRDMATLDSLRSHAVLERQAPDAGMPEDSDSAPLRYADDSVRAEFGLGMEGRLARLDYTNIPEPIYCTRLIDPGIPVKPPRAINRDGPRPPPPPPDPDAPVKTNIRTTDEPMGPG